MGKIMRVRTDEDKETGFTLIEILVVVLIIGVLSAIAIPAFLNQRKGSVDAVVASDVRNAIAPIQEWANSVGAKAQPIPSEVDGGIPGLSPSPGTVLSATGNSHSYCVEGRHAGGDESVLGYHFSSDEGEVSEGSCIDFRPSDASGQEGSYSAFSAGTSMPVDPEKIMVSIWDTSIAGCSTITVPVDGALKGTIDWGDGTVQPLSAKIQHTYSDTPGPKEVKINGTFSSYSGWGSSSQHCITEVTRWGETGTNYIAYAFNDAKNLTKVVAIPSTSVNAVGAMRNTTSFNGNVSTWNTKNIIHMAQFFSGAANFNRSVSSWDVSNVTNMSGMFAGARKFNQSLNSWNISKVTNLGGMFESATSFNQPLDKWDTSNVTNLATIFRYASSFNQPLNTWNTSKVTTLFLTFGAATSFNQPLDKWDTSKVTSMEGLFMNGHNFNQDISSWDTSQVTNMYRTLFDTPKFDRNLSGWNVAKVTNRTQFANHLKAEYLPVWAS